nr:DUF4105 domain-containing protein [Oceanococcus sp. HetDA_MAG_MS8]
MPSVLLRHLLALTLYLGCCTAAQADLLSALEQARDLQLADDPQWRQLLHWPADQRHSEVRDANFWLSEAAQPAAELAATLWALSQPGPYTEQHPLCRFPARRAFLQSRLDWSTTANPLEVCELLAEWQAMVRPTRVTLVFPAYHLNSPSSMFGHTLLRLDPPADPGWSDWLSFSVSFGADITQQDNSMLYAWKGLTGGYPGRFIVSPYFEKIQEYNGIENRDVWEYPLDLSPVETTRMVRHLWELKDIAFDYYFFDKNCSYRVLEMLEIARPGLELTEDFRWTAIPIDTIRAVGEAGLITRQDYRPARGTRLEARLAALPPEQQPWVKKLAADTSLLDHPDFQSLPAEQQAVIIDTAYEYLRFNNSKAALQPAVAARSHRLLRAINAGVATQPADPPRPGAPEESHHSRQLSLRLGERDGQGFSELGLRWSFHDLDDNAHGFLRGAQINIGAMRLRWAQDQLQLQQLDLVNILSLTPRDAFFSPWSWGVRFGLERAPFTLAQDLDWHLSGGGGGSWFWGRRWQSFALLQARVDAPWHMDRDPHLGLGPDLGLLYHGSNTHLLLRATQRWESTGLTEQEATLRATWHLGRQHSLRLNLTQAGPQGQTVPEYWLGWQHFFD